MTNPRTQILHASCVSFCGRAVIIGGTSGAGKSGLALTLMAYGATLVADDRTLISRRGETVTASAPSEIAGMIEARGVGIVRAAFASEVPVVLGVDLDNVEKSRMPEHREISYLGVSFRLLHKVESPHFAAAILQYLRVEQGTLA